ncbi:hypothetical protein NQ317_008477 [Molorchus minor]|uniref:DUF4817 domain-containing protein n=1 Tax=Molorchus minor TaxID=1323400 RepID=A0ABQ9ISP1_9CUCU|nr:hypothetical protein NQ317_008477 [Molorchus minor]
MPGVPGSCFQQVTVPNVRSETERIEILIMIRCGNKMRTQKQVGDLFNNKYPNRQPMFQSTVGKIEKNLGRPVALQIFLKMGEDTNPEENKLDVLLAFQDNPHTSSRQVGLDNNLHHTTVLKILEKDKWHPYKVHLIQDLLEEDFDRREFGYPTHRINNANYRVAQKIIMIRIVIQQMISTGG